MAGMFDDMSEDLESEDGADSDEAEPAGDEPKAPELDGEFAMLAEKLGFTGDQAETFKQAVERCVTLREEGSYAEPVEPLAAEGDMDDDDLEM